MASFAFGSKGADFLDFFRKKEDRQTPGANGKTTPDGKPAGQDLVNTLTTMNQMVMPASKAAKPIQLK